jgi:hypothetical protein
MNAVRAALLAALFATVPAAGQTFRGSVVDAAGRPLAGVRVRTVNARTGRPTSQTVSNREGRFVVMPGAPGTYSLRAEQTGYQAAVSDTVAFAGEETVEMRLVMAAGVGASTLSRPAAATTPGSAPAPAAPARAAADSSEPSAPVRVVGSGVPGQVPDDTQSPLGRAFYERVHAHRGRFLTPEMMSQSVDVTPGGWLRQLPGIAVARGARATITQRVMGTDPGVGMQICTPTLYVNGVVARLEGRTLEEVIAGRDVWGMEFYAQPYQAPDFTPADRDCGILVMWTHLR